MLPISMVWGCQRVRMGYFRGKMTISRGESLHCALLLDYVPPEEPPSMPLGNTLRIRRPKLDWRGP